VDGYVMDTPYFEPINIDLCPAWLSIVAVLHGQPPIDMARPLTWVDLGCGSGVEACTVAAANPNFEVWGCDVNPTHIERARNLARSAELANCSFDEVTFEALVEDSNLGPSEIDVVIVQGVYSWVSPANQRHVVEFIRRRLRPGGIAYVMYESATGWASMKPLAEVLRLHADGDARRSDVAFRAAAETVTALARGGARYFPLAPREAKEFETWSTTDPFYAAHEYLGSNFEPLLFEQVARDLGRARCSFIGSIEATDTMSAFWAPPALNELVARTEDPVLREMLRDVVTMRPLRRDVYRRGVSVPNPVELGAWQRELRIVGTGKVFDPNSVVEVPIGAVTLDPRWYEPLIEALSQSELDVTVIGRMVPEWSVLDALNAMAMMVGGGYALPTRASWADIPSHASARRLNRVLIDENRHGRNHRHLVAPATGGAVHSEYVEMLTLGAVWDGTDHHIEPLTARVIADLDRQGRAVQEAGETVTDPEERELVVEARVEAALRRLDGSLRQLGVGD
jgi:SAM-dependent methyltransferase